MMMSMTKMSNRTITGTEKKKTCSASGLQDV